ncbi:hypothetical protein [Microbacterium lushaniae]|uniref:Uncharacterized protein n=1 Tax=Microbacterium lushaniae TaxID=2614639 RepID=A0A5J6KZS3_9MICO|nr:hypothetical protein [Microbacterium lushaniae]QEW01702.1 hypothetical protein F6J85_00385 [Microbacterium lushaniae]
MTVAAVDNLIDAPGEWTEEHWWRLELRSLRDAAMVQHAVVLFAPTSARNHEYTRVTPGGVLQSLAYIFYLVSAVIGAAMMLRWVWTGASQWDVPLASAGMFTAVGVGVAVYSIIREHRHPRAASRRARWSLALPHVVPGIVTAGLTLTMAQRALVEGGWIWLLVIVLDVVLAIVIFFQGSSSSAPKTPIDNIRQAVLELPNARRRELLDGIQDGVRRLATHGRISAEEERRALSAPLGFLALTMAPGVQSGFFPYTPAA